MIDPFNAYYRWLIDILDKQSELYSGLVKCSAKLLNVQLQLKKKNYKYSDKVLNEIGKIFKDKEEQEKWLECELLLAECKTYSRNKV